MTDKQSAMDVAAVSAPLQFNVQEGESKGNLRYLTFTAATDAPTTKRSEKLGFYNEVTDFRGLDTTRLDSGEMKLLNSHKNGDIGDSLGKIVAYSIKTRGKGGTTLEVTAEFNLEDDNSKAAYEKIQHGIISNASIGYRPKFPGAFKITRLDGAADFDYENEVAAEVRMVNWEILEVSLVPIGEDPAAGINRSMENALTKAYEALGACPNITPKSTSAQRSPTMTDKIETKDATTEVAAPAEEVKTETKAVEAITTKEAVEAQPEAAQDEKIRDIPETKSAEPVFVKAGAAYLTKNAFDIADQGADKDFLVALGEKANEGSGMSEVEVKSAIFDHLASKDNSMKDIAKGQAPAFHKKDAAHNFFNFNKIGKQLALGKGLDGVDGRENELVTEFHGGIDFKSAPPRQNPNSVFIPLSAYAEDAQMKRHIEGWHSQAPLQKRYDVGGTPGSAHAFTGQAFSSQPGHAHQVFNEGWFTEALVNRATVLPHIKFLPVTQTQDLVGVLESGSIQTGFINAENATRSESSGLSFGNRAMRWKLMYGRKDFSQRSLDQTNFLFGTVLDRLRRDLTREGDQEAILGDSNTDGGFLGIWNYHSTPVVGPANGKAITYKDIVEMIETVEAANADVVNSKFILTPKIKGWLRYLQRQSGSTGDVGDVIITSQADGMETIDGYPVITSNWPGLKNQALSSPSATTANEFAIFGDLSDITGAYFSATEMFVDPYSAADVGQTRVYLRLALDIQPNHAASFATAAFRAPA